MAAFEKIPKSLLATTCVKALGLLLLIIGVATPAWVKIVESHVNEEGRNVIHHIYIGLFQSDIDGHVTSFSIGDSTPGYIKACQAMGIMGILTALVETSTAIAGCVCCFKTKPLPKILIYICLTCCVAVAVFSVICIAVWTAKFYVGFIGTSDDIHKSIDYSFALTIVGTVFLEIGGLMFWKLSREAPEAGDNFIPIA